MVKSGKAIFSRLNHIYIPSSKALKCTFYSLYSLLLYIPEVINKKKKKKNPFSQSSPCNSLYPFLCDHLDRACALLCDPNILHHTFRWYQDVPRHKKTLLVVKYEQGYRGIDEVCEQVKASKQKTAGLLQPIIIREWK